MKFEWETIKYDRDSAGTYRAKVIGGWLVKSRTGHFAASPRSETMVFIPDAKHEWTIEE